MRPSTGKVPDLRPPGRHRAHEEASTPEAFRAAQNPSKSLVSAGESMSISPKLFTRLLRFPGFEHRGRSIGGAPMTRRLYLIAIPGKSTIEEIEPELKAEH